MPAFTFLHAADLHLDSPLRGLGRYAGAPDEQIRLAARRALTRLVDLACSKRVNFVLIAGDVYDGDWPDVGTGLFFVREMARLDSAGVPVYLISGNHDAANKMTQSLPYPRNVNRFASDTPQTHRIPDLQVAIHGQSYADASQSRNLVPDYPTAISGWFNIGLLHTSLDGREGHANYSPCNISDLQMLGYDYWALGHVHTREIVSEKSPCVVFPGNIQGRHVHEAGAKGCYLIEVGTRRELTLHFVDLDVFRWTILQVSCDGFGSVEDVHDLIESKLEESIEQAEGRPIAARIVLSGKTRVHDTLAADLPRLRDSLQALALRQGDHIWVERVLVCTTCASGMEVNRQLGLDALSELEQLVSRLSQDPSKLLNLVAESDLKEIWAKLPTDLKVGEDAIRPLDPSWLSQLLPSILPLVNASIKGKK